MIRRSTWIVLAIFVVVLGAAWYLQKNPNALKKPELTPTPGSGFLFDVQENSISTMKVQDSKGRTVALGRDTNGLWQLLQPAGQPTDTGAAEAAVTQLVAVRVVTPLDPAPPLEDIGLATPTYTMTVGTTGGKQLAAYIGNATPTGSGYYARTESGTVFVVTKFGVEDAVKILDNPPIVATPTVEVSLTPGTVLTSTLSVETPGITPSPALAPSALPATPTSTTTESTPAPTP